MSNLYITPGEIKDVAPDAIRASQTKYDDPLLRMARSISRAIDDHTRKRFYPLLEKRYFTASRGDELWIDDLVSVTTVKTDEDADRTYETTWATTDYDLNPFNAVGSHNRLTITPNGNNAFPERVARGVEIDGVWAKVEDRVACYEDSGDTVRDDPMASGATTLTVTSVTADDLFGVSPVFVPGLLLRAGTEFFEVTAANASAKTLTVIGARNGSSAASHAQGVQIDIWRPPAAVRLAAEIMAVRAMSRAQQGFADAQANPELGQLQFVRRMDPEAKKYLEPYMELAGVMPSPTPGFANA